MAINQTIRILSYNILANIYIKPEYYPGADHSFLEWHIRKKYLFDYILKFKADIICLQEYEDLELKAWFTQYGYQSIIYIDQNHSKVGLAIFYLADKLELVSAEKTKLADSQQAAIIAKFNNGHKEFIIINTKIRWVPQEIQKTTYAGYQQIKWLLLSKLPMFVKDSNSIAPTAGHDTTGEIIICGDFNADHHGSIYQLFMQHNLQDIFRDNPYNTVKANNQANRVDFCFASSNLKYLAVNITGLNNQDIVPSATIPSDHLPLIVDFHT